MKFNKILLFWATLAIVSSCSASLNDLPDNDYAPNGESVGLYLSGHVWDESEKPIEGIEVTIEGLPKVFVTTSVGAFWFDESYITLRGNDENLYLYLNVKDPSGVFETKRLKLDNLLIVNNDVKITGMKVILSKQQPVAAVKTI